MKENFAPAIKKIITGIRKLREDRGFTQDYLANRLGISQNAYSKLELGYSKVTVDRLFHIAAILQVSVTELLQFDARKHRQLRVEKE